MNNEWIPVSELNPGDTGRYLAVLSDSNKQYVDVAHFSSVARIWTCRDGWFVTAWQPLPPPPGDDT